MVTSRRSFLTGMAAATLAARADVAPKHDPSLAVFISDIHLNGVEADMPNHVYEIPIFKKVVQDILAMRPLPAKVVCFGDIAYQWGQEADYWLAKELMSPLVKAGIELVLGLGNHDRRDNFFKVWPELAERTPVPGRAVSKVEFPHVDLLLLDTNNALPVEKRKRSHPGELDDAQRKWLEEQLKKTDKPVLTGGHHKPNEDKVKIGTLLLNSPKCVGHIHGHWHRWQRDFLYNGYTKQNLFHYAGLPSTGHWGDIGYTIFRSYPDKVTLTVRQTDFFFTDGPLPKHPADWDSITREHDGQTFTFNLNSPRLF